MIIRIIGEGQYKMHDEGITRLNELDGELEEVLDSGDRARFEDILVEMVEFVRGHGASLPEDSLLPSDAILPSADTSAEELRDMLKDEGLIPGT